MHVYKGRRFKIEAVLANEDVLKPGKYPVCFKILGPGGVAWKKCIELNIPKPSKGGEGLLAVSVLCEEIVLDGEVGTYILAASMQQGGNPAGGIKKFYLSDSTGLQGVEQAVTLWGIEESVEEWLKAKGISCKRFEEHSSSDTREIILVGDMSNTIPGIENWKELLYRIAKGSIAIFLSSKAFKRGEDAMGWLPLENKGRCYEFHDWLYHKECVAKQHPVFNGLQLKGIMDWDYYGTVIPHYVFDGQDTPDEVIAAAFATGYCCPGGYASGVLLGSYTFGAGRFFINTLCILENIDRHPSADRLLMNIISEARKYIDEPLAVLPPDYSKKLAALGFG
jgi:hypothetical protein